MSYQLLTPPELDSKKPADEGSPAGAEEPHLLLQTEGSIWASLVANLRDVFAPVKQAPLELTSKPAEDTLSIRDEPLWKTLVASVRDVFSPPKQAPLELTSKPAEDTLSVREEPIWKTLSNSVKDLLFPRKLAPLQLTSQAVPIADPFALPLQRRLGPGLVSMIVVIGGTLAVLFWNGLRVRAVPPKTPTEVVDLKPYTPIAPPKMDVMGGGGGGGDHDLVQVSKGRIPKLDNKQITPPQIVRNDNPKLAVEPTIIMPKNIPLPQVDMPNLGMPTSTQVQLASNGTGAHGGMGSGSNGGLGSGSGGGYGPGSGGGTGGGVYHVGGGVSPPTVISSVDPEYSDEARRAKYTGIVVVSLIVDTQGNPQHVSVIRRLGMGLDEKAVEAVRQYKFKPAMYQGHAVPVEVNIEVNFQIY
jgi:protein TonB